MGSSLKSKLRQSILLTTGLSLFLLALALVLIAWLGGQALNLARVKAPNVRLTERLQMGVQESQEDLLEWIGTGDPQARLDRKSAWQQQIIPALDSLLGMSADWEEEERLSLVEVRNKIYELEALQWWVEDSSHPSRTSPAVQIYLREIRAVRGELDATLAALLGSLTIPEQSSLLGPLSELRSLTSAAHATFGEFLLSGDPALLARCGAQIDAADTALTLVLDRSATLGAARQEPIALIASLFSAFQQQLGAARSASRPEDADPALALLTREIQPATNAIKASLSLIHQRRTASLESGGKTVENLIWLAMIGLPLFMVATGFVAVRNAAQFQADIVDPINKLSKGADLVNAGDYTSRVEVRTNDELGLLATAFNDMVNSFRGITEVAMAVACGDFSRRLDMIHDRDPLRNAINAMNCKLVEIKGTAKQIARGDYTTDFVPMNEQDELGHALLQMTVNLRESTAQLASSEARSRAIIRTAQDGIITVGEDGVVHSCNPAAERMFGYPPAEIVGRNVSRLFVADDSVEAGWHARTDGHAPPGARELIARRNDATTFPILLSIGEAVVDGKRLFTGIVRDLTQEQMAREALGNYVKEQEEQNWFKSQLSSMYNSSQGITDPRVLCKTMLSELAAALDLGQGLFFCAEDDEIGGKVLTLYASYGCRNPDSEPGTQRVGEGLVGECAQQMKPIVLTDIPEDYLQISSGLGSRKPSEIMLLPVLFKRHLLGVMELAFSREFTKVQREYLDQVVLTIGAILMGVMEQTRTEELLLVTQEQSEGLRVQQEELRVSNEELRRQADQLQVSEEELRVQQAELAEANAQLKQNARNLEERNDLLNARNEELEHARESIRLKAEELENASKYKSEFLANMSHELRTPLNSILVLANLLRENKSKTLDAKQQKFADVIFQSGNDLLTLINEILDLSKIEAGMLELDPSEVPIIEIVKDLDDLFGEVGRSKHLTFEIIVDEECPPRMHADKGRLLQVIKNLISNAFKFTPDGGRVELSFRIGKDRTVLRAEALQQCQTVLALAVRDNGIGIPGDKHEAIFASFQQADGSTSRKYGGTGLGLSISRELVLHMGGEIHLASEEGKGSTFTIYLPAEPVVLAPDRNAGPPDSGAETRPRMAPMPTANGAGARLPGRNGNGNGNGPGTPKPRPVEDDRNRIGGGDRAILIVEDHLPFASVLLDSARENGFRGIIATDGKEGLELIRRFNPEAILLDIELPIMNGWQVLETLKSEPALAAIPVHVMSTVERRDRALRLGAENYLPKPVSPATLKSTFDRIRAAGSPSTGRVVLVVEDDEHQNFAVRELLEGRGFTSVSAFTGKEAILRLKQEAIELIILDLGLPDIHGLDLLDQIRENPATRETPLIVLTGREVEKEEAARIARHDGSIILKTQSSDQRLIDETALCLKQLEENGLVPRNPRKRVSNAREVLAGKRILIVDDDDRNIHALTLLLAEHDMRILVARTGQESLVQLAKHDNLDGVLMDIMMPGMNGFEAIRKIREQARFATLPVIAVTAKSMKGDREECLRAGASDYVSKPVDAEKLLTLLSMWLYR